MRNWKLEIRGFAGANAGVAQLVEHVIGNDEVGSSILLPSLNFMSDFSLNHYMHQALKEA